jgi:hypothetical protein
MNLGGLLYRIEPLVCEDYINKRPVIVPYHRGGKRIHVGVQVSCSSFKRKVKRWNISLFSLDRISSSCVLIWFVTQEFAEDVVTRSHAISRQLKSLKVRFVFLQVVV